MALAFFPNAVSACKPNGDFSNAGIILLEGPWQYQWGSPLETRPRGTWKTVEKPINPPGRDQHNFLWLKRTLPKKQWKNPALLMDGRGLLVAFKAYVNGRQIHGFGNFDQGGLKQFPGVAPHLIPLEQGYQNKELILLVYSDYSNIGIRGRVLIGSKADLILEIIKKHFGRFVIGILMIFLGVFELYGLKDGIKQNSNILFFSALAICLGFYTINSTNIKDIIFPGPIAWVTIYYLSLVIMPAALFGVFRQILFPKLFSFFTLLIRLHGCYAILCFFVYLLALFTIIPNTPGYLLLNILRVVFIVELLFGACLMVNEAFFKKNILAVIYLAGFLPIILSGIRDILIGLGKINSSYSFAHFCGLIFIISLWLVKKQAHSRMQAELNSFSKEIDRRIQEKEFLLKDLHDGVGGLITTIRFLAEMADDNSQNVNTGKMISSISHLSRESIMEIRRLINSLDEKETNWDSLSIDLKHFGNHLIQSMGLTFETIINIDKEAPRLNSVIYLNLFRIYKEALTNIVRHAKAKKVQVIMNVEKTHVILEVKDDGKGFHFKKNSGRGLGNMKKRAEEMGGKLQVSSKTGTHIKIRLPHPFV
jgi:signal transduction histidine kinase